MGINGQTPLEPPPLPDNTGHFFYADMRTGDPKLLEVTQTEEVRYVDILATDKNNSLIMTLNTMQSGSWIYSDLCKNCGTPHSFSTDQTS